MRSPMFCVVCTVVCSCMAFLADDAKLNVLCVLYASTTRHELRLRRCLGNLMIPFEAGDTPHKRRRHVHTPWLTVFLGRGSELGEVFPLSSNNITVKTDFCCGFRIIICGFT